MGWITRLLRSVPVLALAAIITGCEISADGTKTAPTEENPSAALPPGHFHLAEAEFFAPSEERLGLHLGWTTGCVKIVYNCRTDCEIAGVLETWRDGRVEKQRLGQGPLPKGTHTVLVSFSVQPRMSWGRQVDARFVWATQGSDVKVTASSLDISIPRSNTSVERLVLPKVVDASVGNLVPVFGIANDDPGPFKEGSRETPSQTIARVGTGMLVRVGLVSHQVQR